MKELSIEEKAKAYDEALEKSKRLYEQGTITESLAYIFPELKESEDERIRKALISFLKSPFVNENITDEHVAPWLAWLEKQGEQKANYTGDIEIPFGAKDSELQEVSYHIPEGFHAEIEGDKVVMKQGEQKPIKWDEYDEMYVAALITMLRNHCTTDDKLQNELVGWLVCLKTRINV